MGAVKGREDLSVQAHSVEGPQQGNDHGKKEGMNLIDVYKIYLIGYPYSVHVLGEGEESLVNFLDWGLDKL